MQLIYILNIVINLVISRIVIRVEMLAAEMLAAERVNDGHTCSNGIFDISCRRFRHRWRGRLHDNRPRLTCWTRSPISTLRSRQRRRRSSSSGVGAFTIAHTRGSPRLYASSARTTPQSAAWRPPSGFLVACVSGSAVHRVYPTRCKIEGRFLACLMFLPSLLAITDKSSNKAFATHRLTVAK